MKYLVLTLSMISLISCEQQTKESQANTYLNHVGDTEYDESLDAPDFSPCHGDLVLQYYNFGKNIQYKGEKRALINTIESQYKPVNTTDSGYVTIRFIVNCKGETGYFRLTELDDTYKTISLDKQITNQLLEIVKGLKGWNVGMYDDKPYDYYQYLTFKIQSGKITSILP